MSCHTNPELTQDRAVMTPGWVCHCACVVPAGGGGGGGGPQIRVLGKCYISNLTQSVLPTPRFTRPIGLL